VSEGDSRGGGWLNRTVIGAGLTSFLADVGYEMATAVLPGFLRLLHLAPEAVGLVLGVIEGTADLLANAVKLVVGAYSDRIGHRKAFVVGGYALTGSAFALCALAVGWPLVMLAKVLGWVGKGLRGPLRNAILADSVEPAHHGKAFGLHRAGDTLGAIAGPLLGAALLAGLPAAWFDADDEPYRLVFLVTLLPGLGAALTFAVLVREKRFTPRPGLRLGSAVRALPADFRRWLGPVLLFGCGDFSHTLLIFAAGLLLAPAHGVQAAAVTAGLLYAVKNAAGSLAAFPAGWLGDRCGRHRVLVAGYALGVLTLAGFAVLFATETRDVAPLAVLFATAGVYVAIQEALEPAITADLVPEPSQRGTAMGLLGAVNGVGDFVASVGVGALFWLGPVVGFAAAAGVMLAGTVWLVTRGPEFPVSSRVAAGRSVS
jgi:MFS family permease